MKKNISFVQIFLLVASIFAFAHFSGIVNAAETREVATCVESVDGSACQQYPKNTCNSLCSGTCIDGERTSVEACEAGVCIDDDEGMCTDGSTRQRCEERGGRFVTGSEQNIAECERHCCVLGNEAQFVTASRCSILSRELGIETDFDDSIYSADACSLFVKSNVVGACVSPTEKPEEFACIFTSLKNCLATTPGRDNFYEGMLCSNSRLHTVCEKQNYTGCVDGLDGVYWFDSCGNKENIFSSDLEKSWNGGMVLPIDKSCELGLSGELLTNQDECGNCNRLLGSICAEEKDGQELDDTPDSGFVCQDLGCDDNGKRRENGETWCVYTSNFGPSADVPFLGVISSFVSLPIGDLGLHAMSAPGGEHFRKSCVDGEIVNEPCGPYRNGICIESHENVAKGGTISVASCVPNRWAECLNYNKNSDGALGKLTNAISQISSIPGVGAVAGRALALPAQAEKVKVMNMMLTCESDPDCFVKSVSVDKDFRFPMCVPKYPPGFYKKEMDQNDAGICSYASQMCSSVWVKESVAFTFGATAHWVCKANCDCITGNDPDAAMPSQKFVTQMHNLCVSLGDCGMKTNYAGDIGGTLNSYRLKKAVYDGMPKAPDKDRKKTTVFGTPPFPVDDSRVVPGKFIDANDYREYGILSGNGSSGGGSGGSGGGADETGQGIGPRLPHYEPSNQLGILLGFSGVAGATAIGASIALHNGWSVVATAPSVGAVEGGTVIQGVDSTVVSSGLTQAQATAQAGQIQGSLGSEGITGTTVSAVPTHAGLVAFQSAATGAFIGIAIVSLLVGISGIGRGVGTGGTIAYMAAGGIAGAAGGTAIAISGAQTAVSAGTATASQTALAGWAAEHAGFVSFIGPAAIAFAVIIIADIIAQWIAGVGDIKTAEVYFECLPWTAPVISQCDACGKNGLPCNQYNCETLGRECEFLEENEGTNDPNLSLCVAVAFNDVSAPKITALLDDILPEGFAYVNVNGLGSERVQWGIEKSVSADHCVSQFEKISLGFVLDEPGECKYSFTAGTEFDDMFDLSGSGVKYQHRATIGNLWEQIDQENDNVQDVSLYIRCKDYQLDENRGGTVSNENAVTFCVNPVDLTAPLVTDTNFGDNPRVSYTTNSTILIVTFDEFVKNARLDFEDKAFSDMQFEGQCSENVCTFEVPLELGENQFFVRAIDMSDNEMVQGHRIMITRSERPLTIDSITHDGTDLRNATIIRGALLSAVHVMVETSGGVDGRADCTYRIAHNGDTFFHVTGDRTHEQEFSSLLPGQQILDISCTDSAGNNATETVRFLIYADIFFPQITRVYDNSGTLIVITNEAAACSFSHDNCDFRVADATSFDGNGLVHQTSLEMGSTYYVKCKDSYDNEPRECSTIVQGGEFR